MRSLPRPVLALLLTAAVLAPSGCTKPKGGAITVTVIGDSPRLVDPAVGPLPLPDAALLGSVAQGLVQFDARGRQRKVVLEREQWRRAIENRDSLGQAPNATALP